MFRASWSGRSKHSEALPRTNKAAPRLQAGGTYFLLRSDDVLDSERVGKYENSGHGRQQLPGMAHQVLPERAAVRRPRRLWFASSADRNA